MGYPTNNDELETLADITQSFSLHIRMHLIIQKSKIRSIIPCKSHHSTYIFDTGEQIGPMDETIIYKYLGYHQQAKQMQQKQIKLELTNILVC